MGEDVQCWVPIAGRLRAFEGDATHPHGLTASRIVHEERLCVHRATAGGALARGTTEELALELAVLTDLACSAPAYDANHQTQGAKVAILDPELILLTALEPLREQATLLGMAIRVQQHVGHHHTVLVEAPSDLARPGCRPGGAPFLEAMLRRD